MKTKKLLFVSAILFFVNLTFAQNKVSGTVKNASDGSPIPGVNVNLLGTNNAVSTDSDGKYEIDTNNGKVLEYSYIGFSTKRVNVGNSNNLNISLSEDALGLDEIVLTGPSMNTNKKKLGNAIATVKAEDIKNSASTSIDQALTGKIAGALITQNSGNPAGGISITLRGIGTISGNSDPLYIIDGVYLNNNTNNTLNLGGNNQNRLVDLNPNDIERIEVVKGAAGAAIYGARGSNGVVQIFTKKGKIGKTKFNFNSNLRLNSLRKQIAYNEVPFNWNSATSLTDLTQTPVTRYNYQDEIFGQAFGNEQSLNVSGADEKTSFYISGSHLNNEGIVKNTNFERFGINSNIEHKLKSILTLNASFNYTRSTSNDVPNGVLTGNTGAIDGFLFSNNITNPEIDSFGNYPVTSSISPNPREVVNNFKFKTVTNRFVSGFGAKAKFTKNLSANYSLGIDSYNESGTGYLPINNTASGTSKTGFARRADVNFFQFNNDLNLSYNFDITESINSSTTLGGTWQNDRIESIGINATGLGVGVSNASSGITISQGENRVQSAYWGSFIQQSFSFYDKLFINGAIRQDASSLYAKQNRDLLFYKASASYLLSNESFWNNTFKDYINVFKLRAAWGESGNLTAIPEYSDLTAYNSGNLNGQNTLTASVQQGNFDLKPETKVEIEVGVDAGFFNNRLSFEYTYYKQRVRDLLLNRELSPSTGFSSRFDNVGSLENEGMELLVRVNAIKSKDFNWDISFNYGRNRNVVTNIPGGRIILPDSFARSAAIEGQPIGVFYSSYYAREADGSISLDADNLPFFQKNPDGSQALKIIGNPNPEWLGSAISSMQYKNIGFRFQFDTVQGFDVMNWDRRILDNAVFGGGYNAGQELLGNIPKGTGGRRAGIFEDLVEDGSFVKLREVALTYNYKTKTAGIDNIQFSLVGRNLHSWDNYKGWDPEVNSAGQRNGIRGVISGAVPIAKTFQFGVNVSF